MAIKTYTAKKGLDISFGGISGGAPMPSFGGAGLGSSLMNISNTLLRAKDKTELNKTAAANVTQLTNKISDEQYRLDLSREMADIQQNVMEAGGDVYKGTLAFAKKYGLEFRSPEEAKEIFQLTMSQYKTKEKQYADDRTGFILSAAPGAKDALKDFVPEQKEYHEILRSYADQYNIKLDNGFDKNFLKAENDKYATLTGTEKHSYLLGLQESMGKDVFEEFIYGVSAMDKSNFSIVDRSGIFLDEPHARVFFEANASENDIDTSENAGDIKKRAKAITADLLPSFTAGSMQGAEEFNMKMEQVIYRYTNQGFSAQQAEQQARQLFDDDTRSFTNNPLNFVGVVDKNYLNRTYNSDNSKPDFTYNIEQVVKYADDEKLRGLLFDIVAPQMITDIPGIRVEVETEFAGATPEVIEEKVQERTMKKLKSAFVSNMRLVNAKDGRKGFAIQLKEMYDYFDIYGKNGEQLTIPFDVLGNENLFLKAYREGREDPGFIDFGALFRE